MSCRIAIANALLLLYYESVCWYDEYTRLSCDWYIFHYDCHFMDNYWCRNESVAIRRGHDFFRPNNERKSHAAMLIRQVAIKVTSSTSADVYYNFLLIMIGIEEIDGSIIHICDHFKQKQIPSYAPHLCHGALYYSNDRSQFFNERRMLHAPWSRVACLDPMDFAKLSWY